MEHTCKNCGNCYRGKFCNQCGQSSKTSRLDFDFIWGETKYWLVHYNNEIGYTAVQLFTRPGHAVRDYIEGKRIRFFKPISLVIFLSTVYALLYHLFDLNIAHNGNLDQNIEQLPKEVSFGDWMTNHFALVIIITLPIYSVLSYLLFKKQGYNFVEHVVLNSFVAAQRLYLLLASFILVYIFYESRYLLAVRGGLILIEFFLLVWTYVQFFDEMPRWKSLLLTLLTYIILLTLVFLVVLFFEQ